MFLRFHTILISVVSFEIIRCANPGRCLATVFGAVPLKFQAGLFAPQPGLFGELAQALIFFQKHTSRVPLEHLNGSATIGRGNPVGALDTVFFAAGLVRVVRFRRGH